MAKKNDNIIFKTALYLRLSKEDEGGNESSSIKTQRNIVTEYARKNNLFVVDEYSDDGYSGTNYDRPEFKRMLSDIESGKINCVVTKDLSRLGRNAARTSDLLDVYFPKMGVRYIAISECYDSYNRTSGDSLKVALMPTIHEMYARDISEKIRSATKSKRENGQYIGNFAPYGYKKDIEHGDKNHLVVDENAAKIVRKMFNMAENGSSPGEIAKCFNQAGYLTPAVYRCFERPYLNLDNYSKRKEWTSSMVCKMLNNEVYLGKLAQGKTTKVSFKSKLTVENPRDEWIVVENTHEPLISEETFRIVRNRSVSRRCQPTKGFKNVFSGIAKCADCGRNMSATSTRKKGSTYNLCCGGFKSYGTKECSNHKIDYDLLYNSVLQELRGLISLSDEDKSAILDDLRKTEMQYKQNTEKSIQQNLKEKQTRYEKVKLLIKSVYEDRVLKNTPVEIYEELLEGYNKELTTLKESISELEAQIAEQKSKTESYTEFFSLLDEITDIQELTAPLLKKLIDRIEVEQGHFITGEDGKKHKEQKIRIYYRFIGCVDEE